MTHPLDSCTTAERLVLSHAGQKKSSTADEMYVSVSRWTNHHCSCCTQFISNLVVVTSSSSFKCHALTRYSRLHEPWLANNFNSVRDFNNLLRRCGHWTGQL